MSGDAITRHGSVCPVVSGHATRTAPADRTSVIGREDHLSQGLIFNQVPECLANLTQWIGAIDDRREGPRLQQLREDRDRLLLRRQRVARSAQLLIEA